MIFVEVGAKQDCSYTGWLCECKYSPGQLCLELRPPLTSHLDSSRWARSAFWKVAAWLSLHAFQAARLMLRLFRGFVSTQMLLYQQKILCRIFSNVQNRGTSWVSIKRPHVMQESRSQTWLLIALISSPGQFSNRSPKCSSFNHIR